MPLRLGLAFVSTALIALLAACSGGTGSPVSQQTAVSSASPTPIAETKAGPTVGPEISPTSTGLPASTASPSGNAEEPAIDISALMIPACRTDQFTGGNVGFGTVPRAPADTSSGVTQDADLDLFEAVAPITRWIGHFTAESDALWDEAVSEQDFARVLFMESRRLWLACGAVSSAPGLRLSTNLASLIESTLAARHKWLVGRLQALQENPASIRAMDAERSEVSSTLRGLSARLPEFIDQADWLDGSPLSDFGAPNELLEIVVNAPGGWLLFRNRIDIVLVAPPEVQADGVIGLGVPAWNFGTALKVRRFQHVPPWGLDDTAGLMDSLLFRFGDRISDQRSFITNLDAVVRVYESPQDGWTTLAAATVRGSKTYLFEFGCPTGGRDLCESDFQGFLASIEFDDG